jgi:hypothetical protein
LRERVVVVVVVVDSPARTKKRKGGGGAGERTTTERLTGGRKEGKANECARSVASSENNKDRQADDKVIKVRA